MDDYRNGTLRWLTPSTRFLLALGRQIQDDRITLIAAGVAFYGLIAIFPTLLGLVSLFGFFLDPTQLTLLLTDLEEVMPSEAYHLIQAELTRLASQGRSQLGVASLLSIMVALWGAGKGVRAMMSALNVAYRQDETRGFIRLHLMSLGLTLGGLALGVVMLMTLILLPLALKFFDWIPMLESALQLVRWPIMAVFLFLAIALLYRFGADRNGTNTGIWRDWGAWIAIGLWLSGSLGLSVYVSRIASYSATYQSLSAVIILMMWLWMSALVVLIGASINAQIENAST